MVPHVIKEVIRQVTGDARVVRRHLDDTEAREVEVALSPPPLPKSPGSRLTSTECKNTIDKLKKEENEKIT